MTTTTIRQMAFGGMLAGLVIGCAPGGDEIAETAALVEPAAAAEQGTAALPDPVVVSDEPPQELVFSRQLSGAQSRLVDAEFQGKIASARQRGGPVTPMAVGYDLNADGTDEQFVMVESDLWCGSGDVCNIWIYAENSGGWAPLFDEHDKLEDAGSCVSVLPTATNGYRDIRLHGQCRLDMCTYDLRFDGTYYHWDGNRDCTPIPGLEVR